MDIRPGGAFSFPAFTQTPSGVAAAADSLPTAYAFHNGAKDLAAAVSVAPVAGETGMYAVTGTVPATYVTGDVVQIVVKATVSSVSYSFVAGEFVVKSLLRREAFVPSTSSLQYTEDDGVTPLAGLGPLTLQTDLAGNITKR